MKFILALLLIMLFIVNTSNAGQSNSLPFRVIVSTDIGGTDPDDFQSMVHLLLYADTLDIEGLISSPFGPGQKQHILDVIDYYEQDYASLIKHSSNYPTPDQLRAITKQGEKRRAPYQGYRDSTEGSDWIIERARVDDPRPLYLLVWGGIEDLAQALHDAPDIAPKLRVHFIGGPNKKWSPDAYQYIADNFPELWIIESNATYRGWFVGGDQSSKYGNKSFVDHYIKGRGALGSYFVTQLEGVIKMGDTPTVAWLLDGIDPEQPNLSGWGGQFVKSWKPVYQSYTSLTTAADRIAEYGIFELSLPVDKDDIDNPWAYFVVDNQQLPGFFDQNNQVRFRFCPKMAKQFDYQIKSNIPSINGKEGAITAYLTPPEFLNMPDPKRPNWWTDNPESQYVEGKWVGVKTVSQHRKAFLDDFADRLARLPQLNQTEQASP